MNALDGKFLAADACDPRAMAQFAAGLAVWEPRLSVFCCRNTQRLVAVGRTVYALLMDGATTLKRGSVSRPMDAGDMVVIAPDVAVTSDGPGEFVVFAYEGPPPDHFDEGFIARDGFEVHRFDPSGKYRSGCGFRTEVIPAYDLRYRIQYHFVEIQLPILHAHEDMVEIYYVLYGEGYIAIGGSPEALERVPVKAGYVVAVGPHLYHPPSDGLGTSIIFLYDEARHQQRKQEQLTPARREHG